MFEIYQWYFAHSIEKLNDHIVFTFSSLLSNAISDMILEIKLVGGDIELDHFWQIIFSSLKSLSRLPFNFANFFNIFSM